jgi:hypothetical protein
VALRFVTAASGEVSTAPSYEGDTTLLTSIWRTLRADDLVAQVHYGVPETARGATAAHGAKTCASAWRPWQACPAVRRATEFARAFPCHTAR